MKFRIRNKSKNIYIIYSEDKIWGILPVKILPFFSLELDKEVELSNDEIEELKKYITDFARDKLLNYLSFRERSKWECRSYLEHLPLFWEFSKKLVQEAVSNNFINDERFAEIYIEHLIGKGKNSTEIRTKLSEKHISEQIINKVISQKYSAEEKNKILSENVQKALLRLSKFPQKKKYEKCLNYLTRRGFSYSDVKEKIDELV